MTAQLLFVCCKTRSFLRYKTPTWELSSYNGVEALRSVHFVVYNAQSSVRFQHTVGSFHVLPMPVFPPVVDDTWRGVIDGISVMVLRLRTRHVLKEWILGCNLRRLPPCIRIAGLLKAALTNPIPYKAEIFLKILYLSPRISEHRVTVSWGEEPLTLAPWKTLAPNKASVMSPKLTEEMQTNRRHPYKRLNLTLTSCKTYAEA